MQNKYEQALHDVIRQFDPRGENRYFLFGSSVRKERFHDIDLAVVGNKASGKKLSQLRDSFYESTIPYKVDVVDFDATDEGFREYVSHHEPLIWIQ